MAGRRAFRRADGAEYGRQHQSTTDSVGGWVGRPARVLLATVTRGPRAGFVSGIGLLGTYTFYAVETASAAGTLGTAKKPGPGCSTH
jgi:hypothetical protein